MQELVRLGIVAPKLARPALPPALAPLRPPPRLDASSFWAAPVSAAVPNVSRSLMAARDAMTCCEVCGDDEDEPGNELVLCSSHSCQRGYHQYCLNPPLRQVPRRQWLCPDCAVEAAEAAAADAADETAGAFSGMDDDPMDDDHRPLATGSLSADGALPAISVDGMDATLEGRTEAGAAGRDGARGGGSSLAAAREWCARRRKLLEKARAALHLASVPPALLCREEQVSRRLDMT